MVYVLVAATLPRWPSLGPISFMGDHTLETKGSFSGCDSFADVRGSAVAHHHHLGSVNAKQTFCLTRRAIFGANTSRSTSPWRI